MTDVDRIREAFRFYLADETREERDLRALLDGGAVLRVKGADPCRVPAFPGAGRCHLNCLFEAQRNPDEVEQAMGWTKFDSMYFSHSVLRRKADGLLYCITPGHMGQDELDGDGYFPFVVDGELSYNGERVFRSGAPMLERLEIVRRDVASVRSHHAELVGLVGAGELTADQAYGRRL